MVKFAFETSASTGSRPGRAVKNGRGNGALRKIGAVQEGVLRRSFLRTASISTRCSGRFSTRIGSARPFVRSPDTSTNA